MKSCILRITVDYNPEKTNIDQILNELNDVTETLAIEGVDSIHAFEIATLYEQD